MELNINKRIAVIDFETTGFDPYKDEVTEVAVVMIDGINGNEIGAFSSLVKIKANDIPTEVQKITGITKKDTEKGLSFDVVKGVVTELLDGAIVVAHNLPFEAEWLKVQFDIDIPLFYDTLTIDRMNYPEERGHKLEQACERAGITLSNAHRALNDTVATKDLFLEQMTFKDNKRRYLNVLTETQYGLNYRPEKTVRVEPFARK